MQLYNPLTCEGFGDAAMGGWVATGTCMKARLGLVLLFFLVCFLRKWGGEELGISYNFILGLIGCLLPYILVIILFGSFKIALLAGIVGMLIGGYFGGLLFESGGEEG